MNALTNLTGVGGGPGAIGMGPRPTGVPVGGMGAMGQMQIGQHAMAGVAGNPQASECVSSLWCVFAVDAHCGCWLNRIRAALTFSLRFEHVVCVCLRLHSTAQTGSEL